MNFSLQLTNHSMNGLLSRRINKKDRLIYKVDLIEKEVLIISVLGHYN
ncbi:hypothetical protein EOJ36_10060 [Sandaracinomonas limnophila]|uniref:Uncharacterized protein n=1 Tax=Sandaracinomonas limnophila TaxID=1862386 RepID=A0A437PQ77_9BACT|nr:hypothetical protein EOJ36_10060 [Sandaracinomonas limnophila]